MRYAVLGGVVTAVVIEMFLRYSEPDAVRTKPEVSPAHTSVSVAHTSVSAAAPRTTHGYDTEYLRSVKHKDGSTAVESRSAPPKYAINGPELARAWASSDVEDFAGAETTFRGILARTPDEALAAQGLGTTLFFEHRFDESREVFQSLLDQDSHAFTARTGLGAVARVQDRFADAVEEYSLALQDNPTFALSYFGRGVSYLRLGDRAEAEADLSTTVKLLPPYAPLAIQARACLASLRQGLPTIDSQDMLDRSGALLSVSERPSQIQLYCR